MILLMMEITMLKLMLRKMKLSTHMMALTRKNENFEN